MKKLKFIIFTLLIFSLSLCSLFKSKKISYPTGIIFPLEEELNILYEGEIIEAMRREENNLFFSTRNGYVYCVEGKERRVLWKYKAQNQIKSALFQGEAGLYFLDTDDVLYHLAKNGDLIWKRDLKEKIGSGIAVGRQMVFLTTESGKIIALDEASGKIQWSFQTTHRPSTPPYFSPEGRIIFGCEDGNLYFLNERGEEVFRFRLDAKIQSSLYVEGNLLYFGASDQYFYCFDAQKKRIKWKIKTGGKIFSSIKAEGKRIFFLTWNGILYCLNKKNGHLLWWNSIPSRSFYELEIVEKRIVVSSFSPLLVSFDLETGEKIGDFNASGELKSNPLWLEPYLLINIYDSKKEEGRLLFLKKKIDITLRPSKKSPQKEGEEIVFTAKTSGFFMPEFEFYLSRLSRVLFFPSFLLLVEWEKRECVQAKSKHDSWSWYPEEEGVYLVEVRAEDEKQSAEKRVFFIIEKPEIKVNLLASKKSPQELKEEIVFKAVVTGFKNPEYEFHLSYLIGINLDSMPFIFKTIWQRRVSKEKSRENSWIWHPEKPGIYEVRVRVRDERGEAEASIFYEIKKGRED